MASPSPHSGTTTCLRPVHALVLGVGGCFLGWWRLTWSLLFGDLKPLFFVGASGWGLLRYEASRACVTRQLKQLNQTSKPTITNQRLQALSRTVHRFSPEVLSRLNRASHASASLSWSHEDPRSGQRTLRVVGHTWGVVIGHTFTSQAGVEPPTLGVWFSDSAEGRACFSMALLPPSRDINKCLTFVCQQNEFWTFIFGPLYWF